MWSDELLDTMQLLHMRIGELEMIQTQALGVGGSVWGTKERAGSGGARAGGVQGGAGAEGVQPYKLTPRTNLQGIQYKNFEGNSPFSYVINLTRQINRTTEQVQQIRVNHNLDIFIGETIEQESGSYRTPWISRPPPKKNRPLNAYDIPLKEHMKQLTDEKAILFIEVHEDDKDEEQEMLHTVIKLGDAIIRDFWWKKGKSEEEDESEEDDDKEPCTGVIECYQGFKLQYDRKFLYVLDVLDTIYVDTINITMSTGEILNLSVNVNQNVKVTGEPPSPLTVSITGNEWVQDQRPNSEQQDENRLSRQVYLAQLYGCKIPQPKDLTYCNYCVDVFQNWVRIGVKQQRRGAWVLPLVWIHRADMVFPIFTGSEDTNDLTFTGGVGEDGGGGGAGGGAGGHSGRAGPDYFHLSLPDPKRKRQQGAGGGAPVQIDLTGDDPAPAPPVAPVAPPVAPAPAPGVVNQYENDTESDSD